MKRIFRICLTAALAFLVLVPVCGSYTQAVQTVYAEGEEGWQKNSKGWWYRNADGTWPKSQWKLIEGKWYHFNEKGYMETGWIRSTGYWYYLKKSGAMATGWIGVNGKWYYMNPNGTMATGWIEYKGGWYYLKKSGAMATGWIKTGKKWYYLNKNGKMMKNGWFKIGGKWYYLRASGSMTTGWIKYKGDWYYLKDSGDMAVGWQAVQEDKYWFDENGAMVTGFRVIDDEYCYFGMKGELQADGSDPAMVKLKSMSAEEKTAQLFCVTPESLSSSASRSVTDGMIYAYEQIPVGGIILFGNNISTPEQIKQYTSDIHSLGDIQVMTCVDEEGGLVARLANNKAFDLPKYADMETVGDTGDPENARKVGVTIGAYLREYGFDCDFAPDADVDQNGYSNGIGRRAFSKDAKTAAAMVKACIEGFHEKGVITCAKHFPGHGATDTDTHYDFSMTEKTWDELLKCDILPFKSAIKAGTDMIMAGHISVPNVTGDNVPSSVNKKIITDKIRNELFYDGVVITDSIEMEAVSEVYSQSEICVMALNAGADIILMPMDLQEAYTGVLQALNSGTVSSDRLNEAVYRILHLKEQYGMDLYNNN